MSWSVIIGHEEPLARLRAALEAGRLHPALLFEGPGGVGKRLVALTLARALHCPRAPERGGDPCGACRACLAIMESADPARTVENQSLHPGVRVVSLSRPDERELRFGAASSRGEIRSQITVSQIRAVLAEGAVGRSQGPPRVVIIDPADRMGESAANALLKTLEEPRPGERFVLVTARPSALLPTILSRCARVRFGLLPRAALERALEPRAGAAARGGGRAKIDLILALAGGRIGSALALLEGPALDSFRQTRSLLLESFAARARGLPPGTFAVVGAAAMGTREREEWLEAIGVLELLLRDLAVLAADPNAEAVNFDIRDELARLAPILGERAARALPRLDAVRGEFRVNVNARLAFEKILLESG